MCLSERGVMGYRNSGSKNEAQNCGKIIPLHRSSACVINKLMVRERPRKLKIGTMEAHHTSNLWNYLEVKSQRWRSQGRLILSPKVCHIFWMERPMNVLTWYTDGKQRPVLPTSAVTSKIKGQGRKVMWSIWQLLAHSREQKVPEKPKLVGKFFTPLQ